MMEQFHLVSGFKLADSKLAGAKSKRDFSNNESKTFKCTSCRKQSSVFIQIVFEAERGPTYVGDIGLDDVSFFDGSCDGQPAEILLKTTTTTTTLPPTLSMLGKNILPFTA